MKKNDGGPAFPQHGWSSNPDVVEKMKTQGGLTVRDYFAAKALLGILTQSDSVSKGCAEAVANTLAKGEKPFSHVQVTAKAAWAYADAMIEEMEKQ